MKFITRIIRAFVRWLEETDFTYDRFIELESKKHIRRGG